MDNKDKKAYEEYARKFKDKGYARDYDQSFKHRRLRQFTSLRGFVGWLVARCEVRAIQALLSSCKGDPMLDIPCGSGKLISALVDGHTRVIGMDASHEMLSRVDKRDTNEVTLLLADLRNIPLKDNSIETVICHRFLHRMAPEAHAEILREIRRVGQRCGIFYFGVSGRLTSIVVLLERKLGVGDRGKICYASKQLIEEEMRMCGWDVIRGRSVMPLGISTGYLVAARKRPAIGREQA